MQVLFSFLTKGVGRRSGFLKASYWNEQSDGEVGESCGIGLALLTRYEFFFALCNCSGMVSASLLDFVKLSALAKTQDGTAVMHG